MEEVMAQSGVYSVLLLLIHDRLKTKLELGSPRWLRPRFLRGSLFKQLRQFLHSDEPSKVTVLLVAVSIRQNNQSACH